MKVQVSGTFSETNGIDPVTACDPSDQLGGPLHHTPPLAGFISWSDGSQAVTGSMPLLSEKVLDTCTFI